MTFQPPQLTVQGYPVGTGRGGTFIPRRIQAMQLLSQWKYANPDAPDLWLRMEIAIAFQQLLALSLPGHPAAEMIPVTAEMWVSAIGYNLEEDPDRDRVKRGFQQLFRTLRQWPQPADLLAAMPGRTVGAAPCGRPPLGGNADKGTHTGAPLQCDDSLATESLDKIMEMFREKEAADATE